MRIRRAWWWWLVLLLVAGLAQAGGPRAVRKQVEASMLVTGRVTIERDGRVGDWTVDERDKLPAPVAALVDQAVPLWTFEPVLVDGKPVRGSARMSLRVVAKRVADDSGDFAVSIRDGYFGRDALTYDELDAAGLRGSQVKSESMAPPAYPAGALRSNVQGTVYLVLRVNRQGRVDQVVVEQVNLRTVASERQMPKLREMLAKPSVQAARKWRFKPPTAGESAAEDSWTVRVPVSFSMGDPGTVDYGQWEVYIPGPRAPVPWRDARDDDGMSPDTLVAGAIYQAGAGLKLLTPIGG